MGAHAGGFPTSAGTRSPRCLNPARNRTDLSRLASVDGCGACRIASSRYRSAQRRGSAMAFLVSPLRDGGDVDSARRALHGFPEATKILPRAGAGGIGDVAPMIGIWVYGDVIERLFTDAFQAFEKEEV